MNLQYDLVEYSDSTRDSYLQLLPGQERDIARDNPGGPGMIAVARSDAEVPGVNAFMAATFETGGKTALGYQSMDTIVGPKARGQGAFGKLAQCFYERTNGALLYGFPNLSSSPGFSASWAGPISARCRWSPGRFAPVTS